MPSTDDNILILITNFPDSDTAADVSQALIDQQLIACANIMAPCRSLYRWQGKLEDATETPAWFKTTASRAPAAQQALADLHPYDVPEILVLQPDSVHTPYAQWVQAQTQN